MLKLLIVLIVGLLLTAGTYFYEHTDIEGHQTAFSFCNDEKESRGFPFGYDESKSLICYSDVVLPDGRPNSRLVGEVQDSFSYVSAFKSYLFWTVVAFVGYWVFRKLRNIVGTIVIVAISAVAGLMYFGLLVI